MAVWIALLRAVNVAGVNRLPMAELRDLLTSEGLEGVKTYIQSGNIVFRSDKPGPILSEQIADTVYRAFGFRPPIQMLTMAMAEAALAANPFAAEDPSMVHFIFMARELPHATNDFLRSVASPSERYAFQGRVMWLFLPDGFGRSNLARRVMSLPLEITARNMKSVAAVAGLARKLEATK